MQREIKYRGKVRYNGNYLFAGDWAYGSLIRKSKGTFIYVIEQDEFGNIVREFEVEVLPESVGQYTGLKDKNGTDIYESDVCEFFNKYNETWYNRVVRYCPMFACFGLYPDMEEKWNYESDWLKITQIQIIGNTIDNPELIKP